MEDQFDDVVQFFKADEWNQISSYEKLRFQNMYNNYKDMTESGFSVPKPYFMENIEEQEDKTENDEVAEIEKKFKRKCVVDYEMKKRRKGAESVASNRYPKRNIPARNYVEEEEIPEDRYVYCDACMHEYLDSCDEHALIHVHDTAVSAYKNPDRARETVPKGWLEVKQSKISDGGDGIWALRKIPKGIKFGPYEGETGTSHEDGRYCWQIKKNGRVVKYVDGFNTSVSNWMRYVNCARNKEEQNLMAFQYRGQIFYRTVADIEAHTELFVFYGSKFAKELGIDVKNYNSPPTNPFPDKIFKCDNCYLIFCSPMYLDEHVARCTKKYVPIENVTNNSEDDGGVTDGRYECKSCSIRYTIKSLYDYHMKTKHPVYKNPDERYPCKYCSMVFTIRSFYDRHMKVKHSHCETTVNGQSRGDSGLDSSLSASSINTSKSESETSIKKTCTGTASRRFKCTVCAKAFSRNSDLERHARLHTEDKPYECTVCNKRFTEAGSLRSHVLIHTGDRPYECTVCNKRFTQAGNLRRHARVHTGDKPYKCTVCYKRFTNAGNLRTHERVHTGDKPHECTVCYKRFTQTCHLRSHALVHTRDRPYECTVCYKRFTDASALRRHARVHTGDRPYACTVCYKRFTNAGNLRTHERVHTGDRPYECTVCYKRFTDASALRRHAVVHTGDKPYKCTVCYKRFTVNSNLRVHKCKHKK